MLKAANLFIEGTQKNGMEPCPGPKFEAWVKEAGFTEVVHEKLAMPIGPWAKDKTLVRTPCPYLTFPVPSLSAAYTDRTLLGGQKEAGAWNYLQYIEGLEAFMMALFTRMLGWAPEEVNIFLAQVRKEAKDPKIHSMYHL